ncbi:hypothetical protein F4778DRAFT_775770 [Xylariomycetidae sp. FL2044]|nr:hypothetical protein F4778DRAFT_775770 [Xylariomycetidae sp. FL2044]
MAGELSPGQLYAVSVIERVCSVFSLLGCLFIILTFSTSKNFHKPINRLVFYASFGNMMSNVGTLMAREYVTSIDSFGCQFQGFLIQMFLPADALWTLAMAFNVYLTFYQSFDAEKLRKMEIYYIVLCYGVPFIPAITFIFVTKPAAGRMYGDATLWCWISSKWDVFRIAVFYAPVWVAILVTFFIYIRAGREIYNKRKQLHYFGSTTNDPEPLTMDDPFSVKTTEVTVTSETVQQTQQGINLATLGRRGSTAESIVQQDNGAYSVTVSSDARANRKTCTLPEQSATAPQTARARGRTKRRQNAAANSAAWSYTKCAILFFTALLVTWIPSTANRVFSVVHINQVSPTLEIMSALVLPLQGFWNSLIYIVTSWSAVRMTFADLVGGRKKTRPDNKCHHHHHHPPTETNDKHNFAFRVHRGNAHKDLESESMTELAQCERPSSNEDLSSKECEV